MDAEHGRSEKARNKIENTGKFLSGLYNLTVDDPSNHFAEVNAFLNEGGKRNLIAYSRHRSYGDPFAVALCLLRYVTSIKDMYDFIPASYYHTDPKHNLIFYLGTKYMGYSLDAEIFRLIQSYMVGQQKYGSYTENEAFNNSRAFFKRLKKIGKEYNSTVVPIFPEETRERANELLPLKGGFTMAAQELGNAVLLPLALSYPNPRRIPFSRNGLNFGPAHIVIGTPTFPGEFNEYLTERDRLGLTTLLGQRLAEGVPPEERGAYR